MGYESSSSVRSALRVLLCFHCFLFASGVRRFRALCCFFFGRLLFLLRASVGELVRAVIDSPIGYKDSIIYNDDGWDHRYVGWRVGWGILYNNMEALR